MEVTLGISKYQVINFTVEETEAKSIQMAGTMLPFFSFLRKNTYQNLLS